MTVVPTKVFRVTMSIQQTWKLFTWPIRTRYVSSKLIGTGIAILVFFVHVASIELVSAGLVEPTQFRQGAIEGTVIDSSGAPVANATVYLLQNGRSPATVTNAEGNFVLSNVPAGAHRVFAYKESENYPNPVWSFYSYGLQGLPVVEVRTNEVSRGVLVHLPPKAGRLTVLVTDAMTKRPVADASISVNHEGKPTTAFKPGATGRNGELTILVPVGVPVNLKVTAEGYRTWSYRDKNTKPPDAIQLKTGENKSMKIELTKLYPRPRAVR